MKKLILPRFIAKSHVTAYTKKDGTFVAAHEDKRQKHADLKPEHLYSKLADAEDNGGRAAVHGLANEIIQHRPDLEEHVRREAADLGHSLPEHVIRQENAQSKGHQVSSGAQSDGIRESKAEKSKAEKDRLKRAKEQGFSITAYHGTGADFEQFDASKLGGNTKHDSAQSAFFFTSDPKVAHIFTPRSKGQGLMNTHRSDGKANPLKHVSVAKDGYKEGANIMKVRLRLSNPYKMSAKEGLELIFGKKGGDWRDAGEAFAKKVEQLKSEGYDGIVIAGAANTDASEFKATQYVVFDPKNIRSQFANFSKDHADGNHLTKSLVIVRADMVKA